MHAGDTSKYWNRPAVTLCQYKDIVYSVNVHAMQNRCCMHGCYKTRSAAAPPCQASLESKGPIYSTGHVSARDF